MGYVGKHGTARLFKKVKNDLEVIKWDIKSIPCVLWSLSSHTLSWWFITLPPSVYLYNNWRWLASWGSLWHIHLYILFVYNLWEPPVGNDICTKPTIWSLITDPRQILPFMCILKPPPYLIACFIMSATGFFLLTTLQGYRMKRPYTRHYDMVGGMQMRAVQNAH